MNNQYSNDLRVKMGANDFITLFFLVAAVLIFLQLRSVLGRRTGHEKPPVDPFAARQSGREVGSQEEKVVQLPRRETVDEEQKWAEIDAVAPAGSDLNNGLRDLVRADPSFRPKEFIHGARMAYEMIVMAYADGDRKSLKNLLSKEVYDGFEAAISERESRGEVVKSTFVGIHKSDFVHASVKDHEEQITLKIVSQLISATYDRNNTLIEGDAEAVAEVIDFWTFARDVRSRDPNWKLIATESEQ